jgi:hypothetical protein
MRDQEPFADRFSVDIDRLLEHEGRAEDGGPPPEYAGMLSLAEELATWDFSRDSRIRGSLRRRLLNQFRADYASRASKPWWRRPFPSRARWAVGALLGLMTLVLLVGWTPVGRAVAQAVEDFVLELRWPHTTVQQVSPGEPRLTATPDARERLEAELAAGSAWEFEFEGRSFGGCCTSGARNDVVSMSQALDEAGFAVQLPTFLPDGYQLREVRLLGTPPYHVFLIYEGKGGRLGLYQSAVGLLSEEHPDANTAIVESRSVGVVTDGTVETITVGGTQAALIDGERLVWEADGISFHLIGPGLEAETLVGIAESLLPAD